MTHTGLRLVSPASEWESAFLDMVADFQEAGEMVTEYAQALKDFPAYLTYLQGMEAGESLPPGWVPMNVYWLADSQGRILGDCRLRHRLVDHLEKEGGHIGYRIRPSVRGRGYGTRLLALALARAREHNLAKALVTCDADNLASARVIEKNGGILESHIVSEITGKTVKRFWILLTDEE